MSEPGAGAGATDWAALMRLGLGALRLPPETFWAMTPAELARALEGAGLVPVPSRAMGPKGLAALMDRFPDTPSRED